MTTQKENFITSTLHFRDSGEVTTDQKPRRKIDTGSRITIRLTKAMKSELESLCAEKTVKVKPSEFARRAMRRYMRLKNVRLNKNKNGLTNGNLTESLSIKSYPKHFTRNQAVIRAVVAARIIEERQKLQEAI